MLSNQMDHYATGRVRSLAYRKRKDMEPCEYCGSMDKIHRHHDDYTKPLEVRWLCHLCHRRLHGIRDRVPMRMGVFVNAKRIRQAVKMFPRRNAAEAVRAAIREAIGDAFVHSNKHKVGARYRWVQFECTQDDVYGMQLFGDGISRQMYADYAILHVWRKRTGRLK